MKNKRNSQRDDYRLLKNKLLIRTFGMLFFAFALLATMYSLFLRGHIANVFVGFLDNFVYHDYDRALNVYSMYIRDYRSLFFIVLSLILFAIILRFYLNEFSKYFKEINRGIDALIEENTGDIVLPSELTVTEKKINHIKHTLEQRKLATELAEQRKNDLVVYLAHDLKNPLTSVIGYSVFNSSVSYIKRNGRTYQIAPVYRSERDKKTCRETGAELYINHCEIGYELPNDIKIEERGA